MNLVALLFCTQIAPTIVPIKTDTMTANVSIYIVIKALSHQGVRAINNINEPTTIAERMPPIM